MPDAGEAPEHLQMLVVGPQVVGGIPWLDDWIKVQGRQRLGRPALASEGDVGVERRDFLSCLRQPGDREVEEVLLAPRHRRGAQRDISHAVGGEIGEIVAARAVGAFGESDKDVRLVEPIGDRGARQRNSTSPPQRVRHAGHDMQGFHQINAPQLEGPSLSCRRNFGGDLVASVDNLGADERPPFRAGR